MRQFNLTIPSFAFSTLLVMGHSSISLGADSQVMSGLFIEPAITYELAQTSINYPSPLSNSSGSIEGLGLGARLGVHIDEAFFIGMDFRYSMPSFKDSSVHSNSKSISTTWGPVIGMQMPHLGMRVWGSYLVGGELNPEKYNGLDVKFLNARGYLIGTGFRIASISLNLEYQQLKYVSTRLEQIGPFSTSSDFSSVRLSNNSWIASVSFPMAL